ncbi:RICIN domain-containing protein [Streptomyces sp. gb14]|uniref:RICIN domain-containing protein n=1 Tax=Streptomyces sp. gb14 TaxID=1827753 RepID=UPI000BEF4AD1|nr:RICIN domain-containing protein [Streptomyces sp. gb14]
MQMNPPDRYPLSVHAAAALMPPVPELLERAKALATIGLIVDGYAPYTLGTAACPCGPGLALSVPNVGERWLQVHFHKEHGAIVFLWDIDADSAPYDTPQRDTWRRILAQVPDALRPCLYQREAADPWEGELPFITAVMWRRPSDTGWQTSDVIRNVGKPGDLERIDDRALFVLTDLIAPAPATVMMGEGLGVERSSFALAAAVRHITDRRQPLTEDVVRTLNAGRSLADVAAALTSLTPSTPQADTTGHHRLETRARTAADGAPLLTAPEMPLQYDLAHFLLEPDGEGYHRILVHHSGKALQTTAAGPDARIVQAEPAESDAQRFLLQEWVDGTFHDVARIPGFGPHEEDADDETVVQTAAVYRFLAKESGLAFQWGQESGDPIVLATPRAEDESQRFVRSDLFGYGLWMFLSRPDGGPQQAAIVG